MLNFTLSIKREGSIMKKIKCDCGHVNPLGTVLCEACGKPIEENQHIDGNEKKTIKYAL